MVVKTRQSGMGRHQPERVGSGHMGESARAVADGVVCPYVRAEAGRMKPDSLLGRGQVVRHRFLVAAFAGSNPAAPANSARFRRMLLDTVHIWNTQLKIGIKQLGFAPCSLSQINPMLTSS